MALIYGLVGKGKVVLAEYLDQNESEAAINASPGGFPEAPKTARYILNERISKENTPHKRSFGHQKHNFHYKLDENGLCYMVVVQKTEEDANGGRIGIPYKCIEDIQAEFLTNCGGMYQTAGEGGLNNVFARTIREKMDFWNDPNADTASKTKKKVGDAKEVVINQFDNLVKRSQAMDSLEERATLLKEEASELKVNATTMQRKIWWKQKKCQIIMGVACCVSPSSFSFFLSQPFFTRIVTRW
jgi:hypothetical protein